MKEKQHPRTTKKEIYDIYASFIKNQTKGVSLDELMTAHNENRPDNQKSEKALRLILTKLQDCGSVKIAKDGKHDYRVFYPVKDPIVVEQNIETNPPTDDTPKPPTPKQAAFHNFVESIISREVDGETYRLETTQWRQIHEEGF